MILGTQRLKKSQSLIQRDHERNKKGGYQYEQDKGKLQQITCSIIINPQKIPIYQQQNSIQQSSMQQLIRQKYNFSSPSIRQGNLSHCYHHQKMSFYNNNTINQMRLSTLRRENNRENNNSFMKVWSKNNNRFKKSNKNNYRNDMLNQKVNYSLLVKGNNSQLKAASNNMAESIVLPQLTKRDTYWDGNNVRNRKWRENQYDNVKTHLLDEHSKYYGKQFTQRVKAKRLRTQGDQLQQQQPLIEQNHHKTQQQQSQHIDNTTIRRRRIVNCIIQRGFAKKMQNSLVRIRNEKMRIHHQQQQQMSLQTKLNHYNNYNSTGHRKDPVKLLSPMMVIDKRKQFIAPFTTTTSRNSNHLEKLERQQLEQHSILWSTTIKNDHHKKQHSIDPW